MPREQAASFLNFELNLEVPRSCQQNCISDAKLQLFHKEVNGNSDNDLIEPKWTDEENLVSFFQERIKKEIIGLTHGWLEVDLGPRLARVMLQLNWTW